MPLRTLVLCCVTVALVRRKESRMLRGGNDRPPETDGHRAAAVVAAGKHGQIVQRKHTNTEHPPFAPLCPADLG